MYKTPEVQQWTDQSPSSLRVLGRFCINIATVNPQISYGGMQLSTFLVGNKSKEKLNTLLSQPI
jgi:hypothetical protein